MTRRFTEVGGWVVLAVPCLVGLLGCEAETRCYPGDYRGCTCDGGAEGYAICDEAGTGFGACDCASGVPGAGGAGAGETGGAGGGGLLPFMATCASDEECASGLCHTFNAKGPRCTIVCQTDNECPLPSPGCNNMGFCKAP